MKILKICPECHIEKLMLSETSIDFEEYECKNCGAIFIMEYEPRVSRIIRVLEGKDDKVIWE